MTIADWNEGMDMLSVDSESNTISLMKWNSDLNYYVTQKSWNKDYFLELLKTLPTDVGDEGFDSLYDDEEYNWI